MLVELKIRMTSAVLGDSFNSGRGLFEFPRDGAEWEIGSNEMHLWQSHIENAAKSLGLDIDTDSIRLPSSLAMPKIHLMEVSQVARRGDKRIRKSKHEAIPRNVIMTIIIMVRETGAEGSLKFPTIIEITDIFKTIGLYEGISPYGAAYGYGRFRIQSVRELGKSFLEAGCGS